MRAQKLVIAFNNTVPEDTEEKMRLIKELFGSVGEGVSIEHNFHCDLGYNIHVGRNFYAGYNCTILDMAEVRIGDDCMIAPNVGIYTAGSVVTKDVPASTIVAGNPAKVLKHITEQQN